MYLVKSKSSSCICPSCHTLSHRIHSRYVRSLQDVPAHGKSTYVQIQTRKFFCDKCSCPQAIFTERFTWLGTYQRKTKRLQEMLKSIVLSTSCKVASRLSKHLGIVTGHHTLLRLLHRLKLPSYEPPVHIGIDDFAFKKRCRYGTIIINQETRRPMAILNGRDKETVVKWLEQHPTIQMVTRDGSSTYAKAISQALPHAYQITDRWHILKALFTAIKQTLQQSFPSTWRKTEYKNHTSEPLIIRKTDIQRNLYAEKVWQRSLEVKEWKVKGKSISWISRYMDISRSTLNEAVSRIRHEYRASATTHAISRDSLLWKIWSEKNSDWLKSLPSVCLKEFPLISQLFEVTPSFKDIVRKRSTQGIPEWIETYKTYSFPALNTFISYIEKDLQGVMAACVDPLSNGLSEGHIHRVKMLKRMMYGRASDELLKKRVLIPLL
ncbi:ISL3 family transposase (plasmid) [Priestia megaterium]|nr:ISL3 family transposase [Priestia megaterium]MED3821555.1 ISL3 family transposase [Priestia aryabhattai]MCE4092461.1 ISL3 family transposase [Priestia megaterium]MDR4231633.1 ISL3 family transposase [Priestia megaterium]MED4399455.1 ISL3 family transposase [Priestia megaterium]MED4734773.1 ISL3 family transposase [Priestia megaterium]